MTRIFDTLYAENPYQTADLSGVEVDMQGWGSTHFFFKEILNYRKPSLIIEVGTWKGMSAMHMADIGKELGIPDLEICCVDTWLGSPGVWTKKNEVADILKMKDGWPMLYFTFMKNVVERGHHDVITPMPMPSDMGYFVLKQRKVKADMIYIDAGHEYESCKRDLNLYIDLLDDDGIMLGDDYETFPGVTEAAHEFADERGMELVGTRSKFVLSKNKSHVDAMKKVLEEVAERKERVAAAQARAKAKAEAEGNA